MSKRHIINFEVSCGFNAHLEKLLKKRNLTAAELFRLGVGVALLADESKDKGQNTVSLNIEKLIGDLK